MLLDKNSVDEVISFYRANSPVFEECIPSHFGNFNNKEADLRAEIAALLHSVNDAGDEYRIISLGAAPGEWPLKAEQAYKSVKPHGSFKSISLEGDLQHFNLTKTFLEQNGAQLDKHDVRYAVIANKDGYAYFPIVNPGVDWGAGMAAVAENLEDLDDNITMTEIAKADRIGANGGAPLQFRTVKAISLNALLKDSGVVDLLHCDIQGAEQDVFPPQMEVMNEFVKCACIGTHGRQIEADLLACFSANGWTLDCKFECDARDDENGNERVHRDGVFVWTNPNFRK